MNDATILRHWQVKDFPESKRQAVTLAAQAEKKTVAQWLEPAIDAALAGSLTQPIPLVVNREAPPLLAGPSGPAEPSLGDLVDASLKLAAAEGIPDSVKQAAFRAVRDRLRALAPPRRRIAQEE